jgi:hypothetical protein
LLNINTTSFSKEDKEIYERAIKETFEQRIKGIERLLSFYQQEKTFEIEIIILCCCFIDALGKYVYKAEGNRYRFTKILYDYGKFKNNIDFKKVSLFELEKILLDEKERTESQYLSYIIEEIKKDGNGISYDPLFEELLQELLSLKRIDKKILRKLVENATYASILYNRYRNPTVHEFVALHHYPVPGRKDVFYMDVGENSIKIVGSRAFLVFPVEFLVELIKHLFKEKFPN